MKIRKLIIDHWLLVIILIAASILRLWNLGSIPPHIAPDEASLGYNAYSILKTGRDEYGKFLPIIFKSFGDYKPGFYIYLTVPFVATLGLNEFSVRLPSALSGVLSVYLIYLITKKLFNSLGTGNWKLEIVAAFIASTNPWLIFFSRGAWEANVSLSLTLAGIYFFLKSLKVSRYLILSSLFFSLTLITYQGAKLSTAIVLAILALLYWKEIIKFNKKILVGSFLIGFVVSIPIILSIFQGKTERLDVFSVFSYPRPREYLQDMLDEGEEKIGDLNYYLFHSEALNFKRGIIGRWFNHFSAKFLFFEGDWQNPRHSAPNHGVLLLSDLILLAFGILALVRYGFSKEGLFFWLWLILAPLPAALSRDQVHAVRSLNMAVPLVIVLSFGLSSIIGWIKTYSKPILHYSLFIILLLAYAGSYIYFLDAYFIHMPKHNSNSWNYGYKQIVKTITPIQNNYRSIKVSQSFAQPYIYFLFYGGDGYSQGYDPAKYQKQAKLVSSEYKGDVGYVERLENICFCEINWNADSQKKNILIVSDPIKLTPEMYQDEKLYGVIKEIKYLNGNDAAFRIIEVK
ncbi:MAG: glycosyltransferase family 39 protein [Patescibacteria group bacterium]